MEGFGFKGNFVRKEVDEIEDVLFACGNFRAPACGALIPRQV